MAEEELLHCLVQSTPDGVTVLEVHLRKQQPVLLLAACTVLVLLLWYLATMVVAAVPLPTVANTVVVLSP